MQWNLLESKCKTMPLDTEVAWAAGFLDGECCFHSREAKGKRHAYYMTLTLSVTQKEPELLYRLQSVLGCGVVNGPYTQEGRYTHYSFRVTGYDKVYAVAKLVWPYLGVHKKRQAKAAIAKFKQGPKQGSTGSIARGEE